MNKIIKNFKNIRYGPAPEDDSEVLKWINNLPKRSNIKQLTSDLLCDYLIVGAGYTGLSAARQLANNLKSSKIIF